MRETLTTFALMLGAIGGWEFVKWLERLRKPDLKQLVRDALPADPAMDSERDRQLREAL